jgi:3-oxoacyl-[acyl-carrier protein] reductase
MQSPARPKQILVSGGSRGLGLRIVEHLLRTGCGVATFARRLTPELAALGEQHPGKLEAWECDARDYAKLRESVAAYAQRHGGIDGLVNNAAIGQDHMLAQTPPDTITEILGINIEAPIMLTRLVVRQMLLQQSGGRIVTISSICGSRGYPGLSTYSASKGALDAFTRALARELGDRSIHVNAIAPGFFESEMSSVLSSEQLDTIRRRTPSGRLTMPEELLPVLDMLLFAESNLTGQVLYVDGGASV